MASGIQSVRRIEAVDLDGNPVALLVGYTDSGHLAIGLAAAGRDGEIALLDTVARGKFFQQAHLAANRAADAGPS